MTIIRFALVEGRAPKRFAEIRARMQAPLPGAVTEQLATGMRRGGAGSVEDQYRRQAEMSQDASFPWKRTRAFGSRRAPSRTLHDTGALEAAWTGRGAGSVTRHLPHGVEIGVDSRLFPQAIVFQRRRVTVIPVTAKSRMYLGLTFGVWLRKSTRQLHVEPRRVGVNRGMTRRGRSTVGRYFLHGETSAASRRRAA